MSVISVTCGHSSFVGFSQWERVTVIKTLLDTNNSTYIRVKEIDRNARQSEKLNLFNLSPMFYSKLFSPPSPVDVTYAAVACLLAK